MLQSVSVKDYMTGSVTTFKPDQEVMEAIHTLVERRISGAPVVDKRGNIIGMLSEKDCMKVALNAGYHDIWGGKVEEFMTGNVISIDAETSILEVAKMFIESPFKRYPVVSDNRLVGQISRHDVLKALEALR